MTEFQEVMREWVRSRKAINENKLSHYPLEMFTDDHIANIEKEVMEWAAEHLEPIYPTWGEWLYEMGIVGLEPSPRYDENYQMEHFCTPKINSPIPADIAQKLGITPKENN